jgi:LAO/AO transport system kinase
MKLADTTVVVLVPESGDAIQTMKAGLMEAADLFVVNKADRDGADRTVVDLEQMLGLRTEMSAADWVPRVLKTIATANQGIEALVNAIDAHQAWLETSGRREGRIRQRRMAEFHELLSHALESELVKRLEREGRLEPLLEAIASGKKDPYSQAEELAAKYLK